METIKVNTQDLVKGVAELTGNTQKDVKEVIKGIEDYVKAQVKQAKKDTDVEIRVFNGLTIISEYAEPHEARNPKTGETFIAEGKNRVKAKVGVSLKSAANE